LDASLLLAKPRNLRRYKRIRTLRVQGARWRAAIAPHFMRLVYAWVLDSLHRGGMCEQTLGRSLVAGSFVGAPLGLLAQEAFGTMRRGQ
jgi:hypothetical protein